MATKDSITDDIMIHGECITRLLFIRDTMTRMTQYTPRNAMLRSAALWDEMVDFFKDDEDYEDDDKYKPMPIQPASQCYHDWRLVSRYTQTPGIKPVPTDTYKCFNCGMSKLITGSNIAYHDKEGNYVPDETLCLDNRDASLRLIGIEPNRG
jgi:hypothetical protein